MEKNNNSISLATSYQKQITHRLTSKVANEVAELHLAFGFDVGIVQVCVEHDDSKCDQENSIRRLEPRHFIRVAAAVATGKCLQANRVIPITVTQTKHLDGHFPDITQLYCKKTSIYPPIFCAVLSIF